MPIRRADDQQYALGAGLSATGNGVNIKGGEYIFQVDGTVGGSTITLQVLSPNSTWSTVTIFSGSAVSTTTLPYAQTNIMLPAGQVRLAVTGGAGVSVTGHLVGLG